MFVLSGVVVFFYRYFDDFAYNRFCVLSVGLCTQIFDGCLFDFALVWRK